MSKYKKHIINCGGVVGLKKQTIKPFYTFSGFLTEQWTENPRGGKIVNETTITEYGTVFNKKLGLIDGSYRIELISDDYTNLHSLYCVSDNSHASWDVNLITDNYYSFIVNVTLNEDENSGIGFNILDTFIVNSLKVFKL